MSTVAHEGNPRTFSIAVTGTLDGDIFLIPRAEPTTSPPTELPAEPQPSGAPTASCPDVFSWNEEYGDIAFHWPDRIFESAASPATFRQFWDNGLSVTINPSFNCYGVLYTELAKPTNWPSPPLVEVVFNASFLSLVQGAPRAGVCLFVQDPNRDPNNITVAGLITDWAAGTTGLYYWRNGSLANFDDAEVADLQSVTPSEGNAYRIFRINNNDPLSYIGAQIRETAFGSVLYDFNVTGINVPSTEHVTTVGFIAVGGGTSGTVLFGGNGETSSSNSGQTVTVYGETELFDE